MFALHEFTFQLTGLEAFNQVCHSDLMPLAIKE